MPQAYSGRSGWHGMVNSADRAFTMPKSAGRTCASSRTRSHLEGGQCGKQGPADFSLGKFLDRRIAKMFFSASRKWLTGLGRQKDLRLEQRTKLDVLIFPCAGLDGVRDPKMEPEG
jgi:hypothetical protein